MEEKDSRYLQKIYLYITDYSSRFMRLWYTYSKSILTLNLRVENLKSVIDIFL